MKKTTPERTCVGCQRVLPANDLLRVRWDDGSLVTGPGSGRGAWVGPSTACVELATQRKGFNRGLRAEVNAAEIARLLASWSTEPLACPHATD